MLYNENNYYFDVDNITNITFNNRDSKLFNIEEGFNKGNMFNNLYKNYKNYVYKLKVNNQKDELLYQIQMHIFALKDLNLYLDIYPKDESILKEYQIIRKKLDTIKNKYEETYGPLCTNDVTSDDNWSWNNNPWPWDKGGK